VDVRVPVHLWIDQQNEELLVHFEIFREVASLPWVLLKTERDLDPEVLISMITIVIERDHVLVTVLYPLQEIVQESDHMNVKIVEGVATTMNDLDQDQAQEERDLQMMVIVLHEKYLVHDRDLE
jgi:hypothetical protein